MHHKIYTKSNDIGTNILLIRKLIGLTQADVALMAHTSQKQIALYESGRQQMTIGMLYRILDAINADPSDVLPSLDQYRQLNIDSLI